MTFKKILQKIEKLHDKKCHDYADKDDPFKNFRLCEQLGICSVEKGILVRMSDKIGRICNLLDKDVKVEDEKIEDTLMDLAAYAIILIDYKDKKVCKTHLKGRY